MQVRVRPKLGHMAGSSKNWHDTLVACGDIATLTVQRQTRGGKNDRDSGQDTGTLHSGS